MRFLLIRKLFADHITQELKELYFSSAILHFASSAITFFEPIYFLRIGLSIRDILIFYCVIYALYFLLLPLGGRLAKMHGYEHVMLWSSPFLIIYYLCLFAIPYNQIFLFIAPIAIVIQKVLYWPGYHADFARFGRSEERGREISSLIILLSTVAIFGPAFGGLVIYLAGFPTLFIIVSILILLSNIPLLITPEKITPKLFSYKNAFKEVFKKDNLKQTATFIGYSEDLISNIIWSIFIATVITNLFSVGAVISGSILVNALIMLLVGNLVDHHRRLPIARLGTALTVISWFGRVLARNGFGIFLFDNFYRISRSILGISLMSIVYDEAKSTSVMTTMIFREMGLALGKVIGALAAIAVLIIWPDNFNALFILAGVLSLFYFLLAERSKKDGLLIPPTQPDVPTPMPIK